MPIRSKYSPELRDIIERPQDKFSIGVMVFLIVFLLLIILLGLIIKSPDIIVADVRVSSSNPPVTLKPQTSGKIHLIIDSLPNHAECGEYLAYIDNAADYKDIEKLSAILDNSDPFLTAIADFNASGLSLGEISSAFYDYKHALQQYRLLTNQDNKYYTKIKLYNKRLEYDIIDLVNIEKSLKNSEKQFQIKQRDFATDSLLYISGTILENDFYSSQLDILNAERHIISGQSNVDTKLRSIHENRQQIEILKQEYCEQMQMQQIQVEMTYKSLCTQIRNWENKYVIKTTYTGHVELANLISDGDFVTAGEPVFNIIYNDNRYYAIAMLQTGGAGKVKIGAKVNIKLDSFPYAEYGMLHGIVKNISQNSIEKYYLVYISLPNGLTSTSGMKLFFAETLYGQAEIITANRRLLYRVFNSIYKLVSSTRQTEKENNQKSQIKF